ncbi:MAG: HAMP domain-containing histidine kinase [Gammaproteobacteria bacterium]|nr:HAMP domain-containing histidine kinase [Gammaproteobacteria bacterium]
MSLRNKVFLLFGALVAILLGSQWIMMRAITQDVSRELGQVAFEVSRDTASYFILDRFQWNEFISLDAEITQDIYQQDDVITYNPPAIEIRIDNQVKDNHLKLITSSGTQSIPIPREGMIETVALLEKRMLSGTLIILIIGLVIAAYFSHRLSIPLSKLSQAAKEVASGDLGSTINSEGHFASKEIKETVESFNYMSEQLVEVEQLKNQIRENEHYRELGDISRGLAHSIRNPLNTLGLTVEELTRNDLLEEHRNKLSESASRQIQRVDQWIRSFLTFSLSGDTQSESIKLLPLIKDIQLEASQLFQHSIHFKVDSPENIVVDGVEAELKAMIHALIINAVEASPKNGEVIINIAQSEHQITLEVLDQGDGIPEEILKNLYQPHQTTKARGSGMGLFIAYRLAKGRYQGNIQIQNRDTGGALAILTLSKQRMV